MKGCPKCKSDERLGTDDLIPGTAWCTVTDDDEIQYEGETDVCWDDQETVMKDGETMFFCASCGKSYKQSELVVI